MFLWNVLRLVGMCMGFDFLGDLVVGRRCVLVVINGVEVEMF